MGEDSTKAANGERAADMAKRKKGSDESTLLSTADLAQRWQITPKAVRVIAHSGELPYQAIGYRTWRFRLADVEIYEARHRKTR